MEPVIYDEENPVRVTNFVLTPSREVIVKQHSNELGMQEVVLTEEHAQRFIHDLQAMLAETSEVRMRRKYRVTLYRGLYSGSHNPKLHDEVHVVFLTGEEPSREKIISAAYDKFGSYPRSHYCEIELISEREE